MKVFAKIFDAFWIMNLAIFTYFVFEGGTIFGDVNRRQIIVLVHPHQKPLQSTRTNFPAHLRILRSRYITYVTASACDYTEVILHTKKIHAPGNQCHVARMNACYGFTKLRIAL